MFCLFDLSLFIFEVAIESFLPGLDGALVLSIFEQFLLLWFAVQMFHLFSVHLHLLFLADLAYLLIHVLFPYHILDICQLRLQHGFKRRIAVVTTWLRWMLYSALAFESFLLLDLEPSCLQFLLLGLLLLESPLLDPLLVLDIC